MSKQLLKNQKVVSEREKDRREGKGRVLAISRNVYYLLNSDAIYYVESESGDNVYYFVKFKPDVESWCSCKDNSIRGLKCKHLFAIEFAITWRTIKEIDKLPLLEIKERIPTFVQQPNKKSYLEDDYDF